MPSSPKPAKQPLFSVVIPLYNKEPHIGRALDSVLAQTYSDFEIIVVDDGSTDKGPEIVKSYNNEKITLIQQKNAGASRARNRGIREANGLLIAFLDADDAWLPHFLETVAKLHKQFPEAGIYGTAYAWCYPDKSVLSSYLKEKGEHLLECYFREEVTSAMKNSQFTSYLFTSDSFAAPKENLEAVDFYPEDLIHGEDQELYAKIALSYSVAYSPSICACYYQDIVNSTSRKKSKLPVEVPFIRYLSTFSEKELKSRDDYNDIQEYCDLLRFRFATINHNFGHLAYARCLIMQTNYRRYLREKFNFILLPFIPISVQKGVRKVWQYIRNIIGKKQIFLRRNRKFYK